MSKHPAGASAPALAVTEWLPGRTSERVVLAFFFYTAFLSVWRPQSHLHVGLATLLVFCLWILIQAAEQSRAPWLSIVRDWTPLALILVAYWQMDWFAGPTSPRLEEAFEHADRFLLRDLHFHAAIAALGPAFQWLLELVYMLLYAVPPVGLLAVYFAGRRAEADRFVFTLMFGTLTAYALLPHFPTNPPRLAFPGLDLPATTNFLRQYNVATLDHLDIRTSVFPSGHVAVAFSSAFGLLRVLPDRRPIWAAAFAIAALVYVATIYGRYHYAADGAASIAISALSYAVSRRLDA